MVQKSVSADHNSPWVYKTEERDLTWFWLESECSMAMLRSNRRNNIVDSRLKVSLGWDQCCEGMRGNPQPSSRIYTTAIA